LAAWPADSWPDGRLVMRSPRWPVADDWHGLAGRLDALHAVGGRVCCAAPGQTGRPVRPRVVPVAGSAVGTVAEPGCGLPGPAHPQARVAWPVWFPRSVPAGYSSVR